MSEVQAVSRSILKQKKILNLINREKKTNKILERDSSLYIFIFLQISPVINIHFK